VGEISGEEVGVGPPVVSGVGVGVEEVGEGSGEGVALEGSVQGPS
jgi:hypothetical protein